MRAGLDTAGKGGTALGSKVGAGAGATAVAEAVGAVGKCRGAPEHAADSIAIVVSVSLKKTMARCLAGVRFVHVYATINLFRYRGVEQSGSSLGS